MPLTDPPTPEPNAAAVDIRSRFRQLADMCSQHLGAIAAHTQTHGRAALNTALAPDGADLLTAYAQLRTACATLGVAIPELPNP